MVLHTGRNASAWSIDSFSIYASWNLVCTHRSLKIKVFSKWELCVLLNQGSNTVTSRNSAHRNRYFPLSKGMNCRSIGGKHGVEGGALSKQIVKTIRNYYEVLIMENRKKNNKIKAVVETTDEEAKTIKLHHLSRYFLMWQVFQKQIIENV